MIWAFQVKAVMLVYRAFSNSFGDLGKKNKGGGGVCMEGGTCCEL